MKHLMFRLLQIVFAILLLAIAFWPGIGLAYWAAENAVELPYVVVVVAGIWLLLLALNLPLTRKQFQWVGALCFVGMILAGMFYLRGKGLFDAGNSDQLIIAAIVTVGFLIGWFTVSSHLWRTYRGVYGVDDADSGGE